MATFYARYPISSGGGGSVTSVNGQTGVVQIDAIDVPYDNTVSGLTATDVQGAIDEIAASTNGSVVALHTITAPEATAKAITLPSSPTTPATTILTPAGGPGQFYGADFTVSGSTLSWSGLGLDGILSTGDQLTIFYI